MLRQQVCPQVYTGNYIFIETTAASKRIDAPYRSGPSKVWPKSKNLASEAVRREREEEWRKLKSHYNIANL